MGPPALGALRHGRFVKHFDRNRILLQIFAAILGNILEAIWNCIERVPGGIAGAGGRGRRTPIYAVNQFSCVFRIGLSRKSNKALIVSGSVARIKTCNLLECSLSLSCGSVKPIKLVRTIVHIQISANGWSESISREFQLSALWIIVHFMWFIVC